MSLTVFRQSDRLIAQAVVGALGLVWLILLGFDAITAFAQEFDEIGEGDYSAVSALVYTLYTLPRRAYELFPTAAVIGALLGLGSLAATSELTALRAAGLSKQRICAGAVFALLLLTALVTLSGETLGPWGEQQAQQLAVKAKSKDLAVARWSGIWAREGDTFINARKGTVQGEAARTVVILDQVRLYEFDREGRLRSLAQAKSAEHRDGRWTLFDVTRQYFEARRVRSEKQAQESWDSRLEPTVLSLSAQRPRYLSTATLRESLDYLQRNNLDAGAFAPAYWARWFYPLHTLVLCFAALPFAFGALRSGGFGKRLFLGIVLALSYFLLQRLAVDIAQVFHIDLRIGNLVPPLLVGGAALLYFRRAG